jgi:acyl-CoA thioesterase-1
MVFLKKLHRLLWLPLAALFLFSAAASAYSAPKSILVVGDSLSAEYGLARGAGWVALLEQKLQAQKIDARIVNASISGETTSGGRTRLPALLTKHHPDIVIIELGANDGLRGLPVAAARANLRAMIDASRGAGAQVLLVGMRMPPNYGRDYADKFFAMFGTLSKEADLPLTPFMLDGVADKLFQADRLHPLATAHPIILGNIWPHLQPLLKAK